MATLRPRDRADGTRAYQVIFRDRDQGGKQTSLTFDEESEARLFKRFLEANNHSYRLAEQGVIEMRSQAPTLNELIDHHLDTLTGVEKGTVDNYRRLMANHVTDSIGRIRLDTLSRPHVVEWLKGIDRTPKTLKNIHSVVSAALQTGVHSEDWPIEANPAYGIRMPKGGGKNRERPYFLTHGQVDALADMIRKVHDDRPEGSRVPWDPGLFVRFQAHSAARLSEATALRAVTDTTIRADGRIILHINRAWKRNDEGYTMGVTKTRASDRDVALSAVFSEEFRPYLESLAPGDLLFPHRNGQRLHQGWFYDYYWNPARLQLLGAGVLARKPVIHDLRHTHASWLIASGVPLTVVQRRLGHESITTTSDIYGHLTDSADEEAADAA